MEHGISERHRTLYLQDVCGEEEGGDDEDVGLEVNGGVLEEVQQFYDLGDMLDYEAETWVLTETNRILRYMAGVRWQDGRYSSEVAEMCGVEDLSVELRKRRLSWFGHVRRVEGRVLSEVEEIYVLHPQFYIDTKAHRKILHHFTTL
ncbi:hypothetical protein E2C01_035664 [Portunus trituberculatus]|uniref:Uncharacterized protein n=1 Tax=Portunus trituberculatus TaxID=210409 RepID=A0A5B7F4S2_PORTR|nr:hypothetical protein [Portunus trituberculatus]